MYHADAWLMVLGVLLSLALVGGLVWYVNSVIPKALDERQWLTRFVALVLTVFLGVFVADLVVSWDVQLLSNELRVGLFELIKSIVLVVFGYQFGARGQAETPPKPPESEPPAET
jgi:apolipoprotein N-acyltransferase